MFGKFAFALALASTASLPFVATADAAAGQFAPGAGQPALNDGQIENVQFFFGGRNFCWYLDGWNGPGWYWCGYAARQGYGYGGGDGWQGWRRGGGNGFARRNYGGNNFGGHNYGRHYFGGGQSNYGAGGSGPNSAHGRGATGAPIYPHQ